MSIPRTFKRWLGVLGLAAATAILVTACGGGGDGGGSSNSGNSGNNGSGGSDGNSGNTAVINVNAGVANVINIPTISVKVCAPGTSNCQVVNNVLVDTASYGLRLVGSAVSGVLGSLPQVTSGGAPVAECGKFVSSYTWGSVRTVDLSIGAEQARSLPVQIIGDLGTTNVPARARTAERRPTRRARSARTGFSASGRRRSTAARPARRRRRRATTTTRARTATTRAARSRSCRWRSRWPTRFIVSPTAAG